MKDSRRTAPFLKSNPRPFKESCVTRIQTTLDLYAQDDGDETRAAQGEYLAALGVGTQMVQ